VRERARFTLNALRDRGHATHYRLRTHDAVIVLRHNGIDEWVLEEVFGQSVYEPPPEVERILRELAKPPRVLELGGHVGYFGLFLMDRYPSSRITAFEPDPHNSRLLRECISRNGHAANWKVVEACAATKNGWVSFAAGESAMSHVAADGSGNLRVKALDVFPYLQGVDLMKVDIEGGEWALLADDRLAEAGPAVMVFEYHSVSCPQPNAKRAVLDRLTELGYEVRHGEPDPNPDFDPFWGTGVVWAWREPT
jgi:FkbM family methyltransferase